MEFHLLETRCTHRLYAYASSKGTLKGPGYTRIPHTEPGEDKTVPIALLWRLYTTCRW